jgi:non-ribosomal peptide synthase protein (TIGR01720 family)
MVAQGYRNDPKLTAERFIPDPFCPDNKERMYRTGDLVVMHEAGELEFLGRIDNQLKIRGYRVEIDEIESSIKGCPEVREAAVFAVQVSGATRLVGYFSVEEEESGAEWNAKLDQYLRTRLPDYMVPQHLVRLPKLPLNQNGKIDRKDLASRPLPAPLLSKDADEPTSEIEQAILRVWRSVFGEMITGRESYYDMGGDSIRAIQVTSRLRSEGLEVEVADILKHPLISELARAVRLVRQPQETIQLKGPFPTSPAQRWFFEQPNPARDWFTQSVVCYPREPLSAIKVAAALNRLMQEHPILRAAFTSDGRSFDIPETFAKLAIKRVAVGSEEEFVQTAIALQQDLSITAGRMVNGAIVEISGAERLVIVVHHLAVDFISWQVLLEQFQKFYHATEQETKWITANSFPGWTLELSRSTSLFHGEIPFWRKMNTELPTAIREELNFTQIGEGILSEFRLSLEETRELIDANKAFNTNTSELLLAAVAAAFGGLYRSSQVAIDCEGHGRNGVADFKPAIGEAVGWFTALYPVVLPSDCADISAHLVQVKETLRQIPNGGLGFGVLRFLENNESFRLATQSSVSPLIFNFLGETVASSGPLFQRITEFTAGNRHPGFRPHLLEIEAGLQEGQLFLKAASYAPAFSHKELQAFVQEVRAKVGMFVSACSSRTAQLTPSDLTVKSLNQQELSDLLQDA